MDENELPQDANSAADDEQLIELLYNHAKNKQYNQFTQKLLEHTAYHNFSEEQKIKYEEWLADSFALVDKKVPLFQHLSKENIIQMIKEFETKFG